MDPVLVVKFPRMLRDPPSALPPGRYLRSTWILREGVWHQVEDRAVIPDSPVKLDRYVERAVFQYHPVRPALLATPVVEDYVQTSAPVPYGRHFVHALTPEWRAVVAALAPAIHGGYQGFTLPLRFNGRPYGLTDSLSRIHGLDTNHRGSAGGHVTKDERTSRIWQGYRSARSRISRLQRWCRH